MRAMRIPLRKGPRAGRRRVSMVVYLVAAFTACLLALGTMMAMTTAASFRRERERASVELRAAAQDNAHWADETMPQTLQFLQSVSTQEGIIIFDPTECGDVLSGLASVTAQGHIHLFRPDGTQVCALQAPELAARDIPKGDWFAKVQAEHGPVNGGTALDVVSGLPSFTVALPVDGPDGKVGVLAAVLYTGSAPLDLPPGASPKMVLIEVDPDRTLVLATSAGAHMKPGPLDRSSWLAKSLRHGTQTLRDSDGVTRIYQEVTAPASGWHILAGEPRTVALAAAQHELRRNLWLALAVLLTVTILGVILHRRLARPVRRLRDAIEAASTDDTVRAPVEGPAEVAAVAEAFNATIAQRRELEAQLSHQALHDPLTQLPNRTLLSDRLGQALARRDRSDDGRVVVAFMDLDRFKIINDSHGHPAGDAILVALARRLQAATRVTDTVARFGGDEFVMVAEGVDTDDGVAIIATRLTGCLATPFILDGRDIHVSGSVGLAIGTGSETADELIRNADAAMYTAKAENRGTYAIYQDRLNTGALARLEIERDLRRALDDDEFVVHYQPQYSVATGGAVGVEALVRWAHPTRGLVSPAEFIPVSEETGLIVPIGERVLLESCRQAARWREEHALELAVSVNLSARQLARPDLVLNVAMVLAETGAEPNELCLEITEGILLADMAAAVGQLTELRALGVRISIDDFGTGYSSLAYLRTLPIDELKIDRSFITPVADDPSAAAIVASVIGLGHALGLVVVAEGVETQAQLAVLRDLGCDLAQGFYLSRPQPARDLTPALVNHNVEAPTR